MTAWLQRLSGRPEVLLPSAAIDAVRDYREYGEAMKQGE
jgi:hypothetical protein